MLNGQEQEQEQLDLSVDDYSIKDLLKILDLYDDTDNENNTNGDDILKSISNSDILNKTNYYINKFSNEDDVDMSSFFKEIQYRLIDTKKGYQNNIADNYKNTILIPDKIKFDRYKTSPNQIIDGGDISIPVINQETQNIVTTFAPSEVKGTLNPLIKTAYSTFINIDSKYRQNTSGISNTSSNTNFTLDLSQPLKNLLSLQLYSYQIPYSWYLINSQLGNTCFWIEDSSKNALVNISIEPGNYTPASLTAELNTKIVQAGFIFASTITPFVYNETQGKIIFYLYGGIYRINGVDIFTITEKTGIVFFDYNFSLECNLPNCGLKIPSYINQTLGWILGFRSPFIYADSSGNVPSALLDLNGPRYLILIIDDFNQNHLNNNIISITEYDNNLKLPSYYNKSIPYSCNNPTNNVNSLINNTIDLNNNVNAANIISDKLNITYTKTQNILPSAPRTLTQSQIYTINEIIKNNKNNAHYFSKAPTNSDVFAIIPMKRPNAIGTIVTEFSGSLQSNERVYNGPVDVSRLQITLCDDAGNILDLNDVHWSFTMVAKCLYEL